jgi:hypothetical protein
MWTESCPTKLASEHVRLELHALSHPTLDSERTVGQTKRSVFLVVSHCSTLRLAWLVDEGAKWMY